MSIFLAMASVLMSAMRRSWEWHFSQTSAKAAILLSQVLALDPKRAVAYLNLADVLWGLGKKMEAKAHYARYLKLSGERADLPENARTRAR